MTLIDLTMRVSMNASEFVGWLALAMFFGAAMVAVGVARYVDGKRRP